MLYTDSIYEIVINVEQSGFCGMVLAVGRLVRVQKTVSTQVSINRDFTTLSIILDMRES